MQKETAYLSLAVSGHWTRQSLLVKFEAGAIFLSSAQAVTMLVVAVTSRLTALPLHNDTTDWQRDAHGTRRLHTPATTHAFIRSAGPPALRAEDKTHLCSRKSQFMPYLLQYARMHMYAHTQTMEWKKNTLFHFEYLSRTSHALFMRSHTHSRGRLINQQINNSTDHLSPLILSGLSLLRQKKDTSQIPYTKSQTDVSAVTLDYTSFSYYKILISLYLSSASSTFAAAYSLPIWQ